MPLHRLRKTGVLVTVLVVLATVIYFYQRVYAHTLAGGVVPTTFTDTVLISGGDSVSLPIGSVPHDHRVVVAVVPNATDPQGSRNHGVGAIDFIINGSRASWMGLDGNGKIIEAHNTNLSVGEVIMEANIGRNAHSAIRRTDRNWS